MIRSTLAVFAGYFTVAFLNGFTRIIISFYHRQYPDLAGITSLPSPVWGYLLIGLGLLFGLFGGLITLSIAVKPSYQHLLFLVLLLVCSGMISYYMLAETEPAWVLVATPALKIGGVFLGYGIKTRQGEIRNHEHETDLRL